MSRVSPTEVKRWALDVNDWIWGTVQGAFNEKQTASQIIVDAVVGMIPLVGDATAARDLIAVGSRLASQPEKREEVFEWVLMVILIFALIPVVGGVIKGSAAYYSAWARKSRKTKNCCKKSLAF